MPSKSNQAQGDAESGKDARVAYQLSCHRLERMLALGFSLEDAELMTAALVARGEDWHYVKEQLIDRGCSLEQVLRIVL